MVYIPSKPRLRPNGGNVLFLSQINIRNKSLFAALAFLAVSEWGDLVIKTGEIFEMKDKQIYVVHANPFDKWIKFKFEINSTSKENGYLKVFVNDKLKVHEARQTLPTKESWHNLAFGIYNAFKSKATEPYNRQIVYFDSISKSVK